MTQPDGDDLIVILRQILSDLLNEAGGPPEGGFSGYAILAGPDRDVKLIRIHTVRRPGLSPEVAEGDDAVYITALLPPGAGSLPRVTFRPLLVEISLGGETSAVDLPCRIDPEGSSWQVKHGVLDIVCRKA